MSTKNWIGIHIEEAHPAQTSVVSWALFDNLFNLIDHGSSPLASVRAQAGPEAGDADVYAYVLGSVVTLTEVSIPSQQAAHLRKALPFMIEEHVIGDLRQTHLAVATKRYGDSVPVAVVSHEQMIAWLEALHVAGLSPVAVIPEQLLLPREPGSLFVHVHRDRALLRLGDCRGAVVALDNVPMVLELALKERALPCSRIELSACADSLDDMNRGDALAAEIGARLDRPVVRTNYEESLVELLSITARSPQTHINLCQGGYRADPRSAENSAAWRRTWMTAAACLLIFVLTSLAAGYYIEARTRATQAQALAMFREMFPDEKRVINLRRQAEARLGAAVSAGKGPLGAMSALAGALSSPDSSGISLQALEYKASEGALNATIGARSLETIYALEKRITGGGGDATVQSPTEEGGLASAKLQLRTR
jgi:general secretion pathway protein L